MDLIDTTVLVLQHRHDPVKTWLRSALLSGDAAICDVVALEYLAGARNGAEYEALEGWLRAMPWYRIEAADWDRAFEVYRALALRGGGYQRSVKHADLLVATVAERNGLAVVHYDEDYDRIGSVTGQPTRWVVPRGTI